MLCCTWLHGAGTNINWQDDMGKTPLMYAVSFSMLTFCKIPSILVKAGADVSITNCSGHTVMHEAVMYDTLYNFCDPSKSNRSIMLANLGISPAKTNSVINSCGLPSCSKDDYRLIHAIWSIQWNLSIRYHCILHIVLHWWSLENEEKSTMVVTTYPNIYAYNYMEKFHLWVL